ncbi:MAG: MoxR family ATPase [Planctomycetota bacterium]|nr:MAG: MoxR family ATPase [Planctomycetota bacterium]
MTSGTDPAPVSDEELERARGLFDALADQIARVIVGQHEAIEQLLWALGAGGHALLEGAPGLGKTMLVRTIASALQLDVRRVQCTPDLMPADVLGTTVVAETSAGERSLVFEPGPIFTHLLLVDEINRATPRTQSALLEAMQERRVTTGGQSRPLPSPFFVLATQNPIEMEGTYPLPEAQLDRFLVKIVIDPPDRADLVEVLRRTAAPQPPRLEPVGDGEALLAAARVLHAMPCAEPVLDYAARLVLATHPARAEAPEPVRRYVRYGASPRGAQALIGCARVRALRRGQACVGFEDVAAAVAPALRHRVLLGFEGLAEGLRPDTILDSVLETVSPAPAVDRAASR